MYEYVLFDLDGTLTDPKLGITKSVQYALKSFGMEEPDPDKLEHFIGPPLGDSFATNYGFDGEQCDKAIKTFREYFESTGIKENQIFPGMADMLKRLHEKGYILAIASSKPEESVHVVLRNFEIEQYFQIIVGSLKDGSRITKVEVMEETFAQLRKIAKRKGRVYDSSKVLMVGDRKFDIEGAQHFGVDSAAVTYGYAPQGELRAAGPTYMTDSVEGLEEIITGQKSYLQYVEMSAFRKTLEILMPLLAYWAVEMLVFNVLYLLFHKATFIRGSFTDQMHVYLNAIAAVATWPMLAALYQRSVKLDTSHVVTRHKRKRLHREMGLIAAYSIALGVGLNLIVSFFQLSARSNVYTQVSNVQYSVALPIGLVVYGILTPFTEELIFRGVIYNRIKKYFPLPLSIFLSGLLFGCYHGNVVQAIYACIMGVAMSFLYEYYGMLGAPIIFHCSANFIVYLLSKVGFGNYGGAFWYGMMLLLVSGFVTMWYVRMYQQKRHLG